MEQFIRKPFTLDRTVRIVVIVALALLLISMISAIWEVLLPFLLAGIFAYVVMPLVRFFQYKLGVRIRGLAVLLVFLLISAIITLNVVYLVPSIEQEFEKTLEAISSYSAGRSLLEMLLPEWLLRNVKESLDFQELSALFSADNIVATSRTLWGQINGIVSGTLSVFSWGLVFAMGLVYFIFIMLDFEGLIHGLIRLFPKSIQQPVTDIFKEVDFYMNSYFRGQALIAMTVATLLSIGFNIIGLPMATAIGIFIGLLNFVPYMQALGILPLSLMATLMAAQTGQSVFFCFLLAFGVLMLVQILQDTLIVPRIMGQSMGMRPSLILLSLSIWGYLLGFFGMLIALPLTMSLYSIYMRYILKDEEYIEELTEKLEPSIKEGNKPDQTSQS